MEGFKSLPKMKAFREGGHAKREEYCGGGMTKKAGGKIAHEDIAEDKKLIKKAFKQHDEAKHDSEPTEIKLRKGGRAKKDCGTVTKYKSGGNVAKDNAKPSGDKDATKKVPPTGDKKACAPSKGEEKAPAGKAEFFKRGGVKKFNGGGLSNPMVDSGASPFQAVNAKFGPNAPAMPPLAQAEVLQQNQPAALRRGGKVK